MIIHSVSGAVLGPLMLVNKVDKMPAILVFLSRGQQPGNGQLGLTEISSIQGPRPWRLKGTRAENTQNNQNAIAFFT